MTEGIELFEKSFGVDACDNGMDASKKYMTVLKDHPVLRDFPRLKEIEEYDQYSRFGLEEILWELRDYAKKEGVIYA